MKPAPTLSDSLPPFARRTALALAAATLALHAAAATGYGYFRDELYFLDCARHPMWGYVDDAPGIAWLAKVALGLGGSLPAVRILPALAGAGTVLLTCLLARELGGRRFAQAFAGICVMASPVFLMEHGLLCVGAFEPLFWIGCLLLVLRLGRGGDPRLWLAFGAVAGLGVELKYTMGLVLLCLAVALALSPLRRAGRQSLFWAGVAVCVALLLPTLLWQVGHHWPLLTDLGNIRRLHKNVELPAPAFLFQQVMLIHPLLAPVWIAGLIRFLRRRQERILGLWYLLLLGSLMALKAKDYYLAAAYPVLFAGGAAALEEALESWATRGRRWPGALLTGLAGLLFLLDASAFTPLLPPGRLQAWQARLGIRERKAEAAFDGPLMQPFSDQFGWPELAEETARIFQALPAPERARTGIFANNYGEAGAIDQFGPALGLPTCICAHQACSFWGPPAVPPETFICLGLGRKALEGAFTSVTEAAQHRHPWGMGYENRPIYVCRGLKRPLGELWPEITHWD